ncbi:MAG TPA: substrate-binding domain-containing protein [Conexibacter sp.]|jgi:ribose transport system substrate-binding protein|nr:substrate-binding domain-containing protein [Conexibacter sp.]
MRRRASLTLTISAAVVAMAAGGCGSGGGGGGGSTSSGGGAAAADQQAVDALYKGTYQAPPQAPKPAPGKSILLLSCGQSLPTCAAAMTGAQEAAGKMGWKTTIFDTKGDPNQASAGIRQALVSKADGVFLYFTDCRLMKQALQEAKSAKLPVVAAESLDCDYGGGTPLFAATVRYAEGSYADWIAAYGKAQAQYVIAKTGGKAKVLDFVEDDLLGASIQQQAEVAALRACAGCKVYPVKYTIGDLSTGIQQKAQQALLQHPDANATIVQYDAVLLSGVSAATQAAGRKLVVMAAEGDTATMDLVRSGKVTAGVGIPIEWEGYAGVDALNRLLHGRPTATSGIGLQVYDKDHNTPPSGPYKPPIDFRAAYGKAWGLGG